MFRNKKVNKELFKLEKIYHFIKINCFRMRSVTLFATHPLWFCHKFSYSLLLNQRRWTVVGKQIICCSESRTRRDENNFILRAYEWYVSAKRNQISNFLELHVKYYNDSFCVLLHTIIQLPKFFSHVHDTLRRLVTKPAKSKIKFTFKRWLKIEICTNYKRKNKKCVFWLWKNLVFLYFQFFKMNLAGYSTKRFNYHY